MFIEKPWGHEILLIHTDKYAAKKLFIFPGKRLSRQYHKTKQESLIYLSGDGYVEYNVGSLQHQMNFRKVDGPFTIAPGIIHRICAREGTHLELLEVSTPELSDVVQLEDDFGRV